MSPSVKEAVNTLRAREVAAREAREQHRRRSLDAVIAALRPLLRSGDRGWVFGSLAWGGFSASSDLDLALEGVEGARLVDIERTAARAAGVPVDLVDLGDLPPSFQERILRDGVLIR